MFDTSDKLEFLVQLAANSKCWWTTAVDLTTTGMSNKVSASNLKIHSLRIVDSHVTIIIKTRFIDGGFASTTSTCFGSFSKLPFSFFVSLLQ